ncbi:hypothetical protein D3C75_1110100 [compost metagenome]
MTQVVDFSKSSITSFSQSIAIPIVGSPSSNTLTQFGLATAQGGNVQLNATVGVQTTLGNPDLQFTLWRGGTSIFTTNTSLPAAGQYEAVSFSYVDSNVPSGYFAYTMSVSIVNSIALNTANLVGPVDFSGLSLV